MLSDRLNQRSFHVKAMYKLIKWELKYFMQIKRIILTHLSQRHAIQIKSWKILHNKSTVADVFYTDDCIDYVITAHSEACIYTRDLIMRKTQIDSLSNNST